MSNIELVSYKEYPSDQYTKAICTLLIDGKYCVCFGKKSGKDGQSWWKPATFSVDEGGGTKKYVDGFCMDSNSANEKMLEFVKQCEKNRGGVSVKASDVPFIQREVANEQPLPF